MVYATWKHLALFYRANHEILFLNSQVGSSLNTNQDDNKVHSKPDVTYLHRYLPQLFWYVFPFPLNHEEVKGRKLFDKSPKEKVTWREVGRPWWPTCKSVIVVCSTPNPTLLSSRDLSFGKTPCCLKFCVPFIDWYSSWWWFVKTCPKISLDNS